MHFSAKPKSAKLAALRRGKQLKATLKGLLHSEGRNSRTAKEGKHPMTDISDKPRRIPGLKSKVLKTFIPKLGKSFKDQELPKPEKKKKLLLSFIPPWLIISPKPKLPDICFPSSHLSSPYTENMLRWQDKDFTDFRRRQPSKATWFNSPIQIPAPLPKNAQLQMEDIEELGLNLQVSSAHVKPAYPTNHSTTHTNGQSQHREAARCQRRQRARKALMNVSFEPMKCSSELPKNHRPPSIAIMPLHHSPPKLTSPGPSPLRNSFIALPDAPCDTEEAAGIVDNLSSMLAPADQNLSEQNTPELSARKESDGNLNSQSSATSDEAEVPSNPRTSSPFAGSDTTIDTTLIATPPSLGGRLNRSEPLNTAVESYSSNHDVAFDIAVGLLDVLKDNTVADGSGEGSPLDPSFDFSRDDTFGAGMGGRGASLFEELAAAHLCHREKA